MIRYTMRTDSTTLLGPGLRAALWVHGCDRGCPGCIAAQSNHAPPGHEASPAALADWFLATGREGLTISGGEPFQQAEELAEMLRLIRRRKPTTTVIAYTGYRVEELDSRQQTLLMQCDLVIDGPYQQDRRDGAAFAVGSANQRLVDITGRVDQEMIHMYYFSGRSSSAEIRLEDGQIKLIGVPNHQQYKLWKKLKEEFK